MLLVGPIWAYLNICVLESAVQNLVSPFYKIYFVGPQMLFTVLITRAARKKHGCTIAVNTVILAVCRDFQPWP